MQPTDGLTSWKGVHTLVFAMGLALKVAAIMSLQSDLVAWCSHAWINNPFFLYSFRCLFDLGSLFVCDLYVRVIHNTN